MNKTMLAKAVRVTPATVAAYEKGQSEPSREVVDRLSEVLRFPSSFFFAELADSMPLDGASFRALSRMTASQRDAALAAGTLCIALNDWIEERFELPSSDVPDLDAGIIKPEGAAALVRGRWGLGEAPIQHVLHLLESHGVRVFSLAEECRDVDAFSFWHRDTPFMCLNTEKTAERSIFDAAHELGHLVLHRDHAAPRGRSEEREADAFASNFLMPASDVQAMAPRNPDLVALSKAKTRWRVSAAALNYRLHDLGITSDWHYRELAIEISRLGRHREVNPLPPEQSQILAKVLSALRTEGVSRQDIAKALHVHQSDFDALVAGLTFGAIEGGGTGSSAETAPLLKLV